MMASSFDQPPTEAAQQYNDGHPDVHVLMERASLDEIPHFELPPGYRLRAYRLGDEFTWTRLQRAADWINEITETLFTEQYGDNRAALPTRMFFVETATGEAVATISAWWETRAFADPANRGRIHWVAVHPAHQRRGLSKPMMTHALLRLAEHHSQAMLETSSHRPWAIKVYLDCGFLPATSDLATPARAEAWRRVQTLLRHSELARVL